MSKAPLAILSKSNLKGVLMIKYTFTLFLFLLGIIVAQSEPTSVEWKDIELTNVKTGETFTLASFEGKTVFVEPMATWCSNCRRQFSNLMEAKSQLSDVDENYVFVALSIEGNIANESLAQYAEREGFDFTFAVASPDLVRDLVDDFGRSVISPPSTPHFIIRPDGSNTSLETGLESTEELLSQLLAISSETSEPTS